MPPQMRTSGHRSAPFGHDTVPPSIPDPGEHLRLFPDRIEDGTGQQWTDVALDCRAVRQTEPEAMSR